MSAKPILESTGKGLLAKHLDSKTSIQPLHYAYVTQNTNWSDIIATNPWLQTETKLVVKPDQLIKRRGKLGLVGICQGLEEVKKWIEGKMGQEIKIGGAEGKVKSFIIEPFVAHDQSEEMYICIYSHRSADRILFHRQGGVDIGDVDKVAKQLDIPVQLDYSIAPLQANPPVFDCDDCQLDTLLVGLNKEIKDVLKRVVRDLYLVYVKLNFTYLEVNPLVVKKNGDVFIMDLAAKLDSAAEFLCKPMWGEITFPPPFGRDAFPEESYIADLDSKSGASLKLTILNPKGRIWTMVAGGGASVIYADTICELGGASELANYGEYSGAPTEQQTYEYAKTLLSLMTRGEDIHPDGKVLIIGGGIANFTNVAATFRGIVTALQEAQPLLVKHKVQIYVRRGGPNYQEGLRRIRSLGRGLGLPVHVFGPETHMTAVCGMALGHVPTPATHQTDEGATAKFLLPGGQVEDSGSPMRLDGELDDNTELTDGAVGDAVSKYRPMFTEYTKAIVWGMQTRAVQSMLDFDFVCRRAEPSVVAMVYPFTGDHKQKFYWGHKEILIPVFRHMRDACTAHRTADVLVNFASLRSAYESTLQALRDHPQIHTIAIIAEGIPENLTRKLVKEASANGVAIIGPATVGGIKPGCFKVGNTGGMMDNILHARLYRPGSVAYVSRSGGMSNELNNLVARASDGVYEGVAIGGDRYPGTTFIDHLFRYELDPNARLLILLGEVGGTEEYEVCEALRDGRLSKPLVAWCIGTCATHFSTEVQFGHAGSSAHSRSERAHEKNQALREAGAHVPDSFDQLHQLVESVFKDMVDKGALVPREDTLPPTVPMDFSWARELGLIRKPASFISSICDERGQELIYSGIPVSDVLHQDLGIGGVIGLLWFQRKLPKYICKYFEMCLMLTADHGPAVSGAHNTIVCARAGKDLVSSLVSGLLTIGERFGGALDSAARQFSEAFDRGLHPSEFVNEMRSKGQLIMGIGHRVKSINNPDQRVKIIKDYVLAHFPSTTLLEYALQVEKLTTAKKPNLILNVDGVIATTFVDMLRGCACFTRDEAQEYIDIGAINSLFVLGRSIGFIGHYMDQKRLKQGLYRHPWDDISYILPEQYQ